MTIADLCSSLQKWIISIWGEIISTIGNIKLETIGYIAVGIFLLFIYINAIPDIIRSFSEEIEKINKEKKIISEEDT